MSRLTKLASQAQQAIASGEIDKAIDVYRLATQDRFDPQRATLLAEYGFLLWQNYEFQKAKDCFDELLTDPNAEISTLPLIAKSYFGVGQFKLATEVMIEAVRRCGTDSDLIFLLASCLERSNRLDEAREVAERAIRYQADHRQAVRLRSHIDRRAGDLASAIDRLTRHLSSFPNGETWMLQYELAACLDRVGSYVEAWNCLIEAKQQVASFSRQGLIDSYAIRKSQGELSKRITDADLTRWNQTELPSRCKIVFLAGFPRSGTTLLESILTAHPATIGTDETGILSRQFIQPIVWEAKDALDALLEIRSLDTGQIQVGRETYLRMTSAVIGSPISNRWLIEKDPLLTCDLPVPLRLFPESRIIMPLRDPRDVITSYFFTMVPFHWNSSPATDIVESARFYHDTMRHWLLLRPRLQWPWIETRYEDLVSQPATEVKRLSNFLGIDFQSMMLDPRNRASERMVVTPTYDDVAKPIYSSAVGRWQNYRKQLEPAMPILDSWAKSFGYE